MIRVLHYIGLLQYGGSQSFVMELYRKIDRTKVQFDFVTFPNEKEGFYDEIIALGGRVFESPQYNGKNHFEFCKWWNCFFKEHSEYKIFHSHVRSVATICIHIAHKYGLYAIAHSHSTSNGHGISSVIKYTMQLPLRNQADYLFACSDQAGKWLFGKNIKKRKNYQVISNAIDAERFSYKESKREEIRHQLGLENKYVIGHIGRMTEPKNHMFLIDVFSEVLKKREDAVLLLIGDGELKDEIENKCKRLDLNNHVVMLGSRGNTQDYYHALDIFVFPSLWEGLGIVAIEAQASGLQCVVSERIPKEIVIAEDLVHVMELSEKPSIWAEKIFSLDIRGRKSRTQEIGLAGYDITGNARKMQNFYHKVIEKMENK